MSHSGRIGIVRPEAGQQGGERGTLCSGARVGRTALRIQATLVADADAVPVPPPGMCSLPVERASPVDEAVAGDVEVIADVGKTAVADMILTASLERIVTITTRGRAVNHQERDLPVVLVLAGTQDRLIGGGGRSRPAFLPASHGCHTPSTKQPGTGGDAEGTGYGRSHSNNNFEHGAPNFLFFSHSNF